MNSPSKSSHLQSPFNNDNIQNIQQLFLQTRKQSQQLVAHLPPEDWMLQSMEDASPLKWHLAHTSWFFETFILARFKSGYEADERFSYLFNSYYVQAGPRFTRAQRGLISRPTCQEVVEYRSMIDEQIIHLWEHEQSQEFWRLIELGCHHEMQHQELMLTDLLHALSFNPLRPAYKAAQPLPLSKPNMAKWLEETYQKIEIGCESDESDLCQFAYDNEKPRHHILLHPHKISDSLVTNQQWQDFIDDGGYKNPLLWLSDGWAKCQQENWQAPLYWWQQDKQWWNFSLRGAQPIDPNAPVTHISFYEADAFAKWSNARLPREEEWEHQAVKQHIEGNFLEEKHLRPRPKSTDNQQFFGDVWEWTQSAYLPYPRYKPPSGAIGEYNGKFMCNQIVLRGGSCVTPQSQVRSTYRNFFYPHQRWQFSGLRLAKDI